MRPGDPANGSPAIKPTCYELAASDGYRIAVRRYASPDARARIVVAGATGVPQGFYRRFATHAVTAGFDVMTFDYRGIGNSAPSTLRGFTMDYRDWGRRDLAAVIADTAGDDLSTHLVAHSYGGQALGLLPDLSRLQSMHAFGTGTGWTGWMPPLERVRVRFLWHVVGPLLTGASGYLAWKRLGLGEDLPLDVYRQWKRWCHFPAYYFDDPEIADEMMALYARVEVPIVAINATDDRWIPPRVPQRLHGLLPQRAAGDPRRTPDRSRHQIDRAHGLLPSKRGAALGRRSQRYRG